MRRRYPSRLPADCPPAARRVLAGSRYTSLVNFFGHAVAARLVDDDPAFVLGAMAPDLLPLCGAVADGETSPRVGAGQAHHRSVDAIFHSSPAFPALQAWARRALRGLGLPRGPARGAAHVGIELFLDGALARETRDRDA